MYPINLLKASDVVKMRQKPQVIFLPDTFRTSILSCDCSLRAMQAGRGRSVCAGVWARWGASWRGVSEGDQVVLVIQAAESQAPTS